MILFTYLKIILLQYFSIFSFQLYPKRVAHEKEPNKEQGQYSQSVSAFVCPA